MQIAILIFERCSALDAVALHRALRAAADDDAVLVAARPGPIRDATGRLELTADAALQEIPRPDVIAIPGGAGAARASHDQTTVAWIAAAVQAGARAVTVGAGSLLVARAGVRTRSRSIPSAEQLLADNHERNETE